eukprot:1179274-Prorocentrum_minimum.AAC.3
MDSSVGKDSLRRLILYGGGCNGLAPIGWSEFIQTQTLATDARMRRVSGLLCQLKRYCQRAAQGNDSVPHCDAKYVSPRGQLEC